MSNERSRQKLLEFLDYLADKGLMTSATISARKAAASRVLGILSDQEAEDITTLDLDEVMKRFQNLEGKKYSPGSLSTYLSRVKSTVDDFRTYLDNPLGFRPSVQSRSRRKPDGKREVRANARTEQRSGQEKQTVSTPMSNSILPIPIRADTTVFIQGIPFDLTESEASKIANVVRAMANLAD